MAVGLPIVTTDAGGMSEAVRDGIEGYVVPVRDIPAFTQRLGALLQNPAQRQAMGEAARARVAAEFTIERQLQVFEQLYTHLLSAPGEP
jgi:glycosyltransferase involved in cell wall biosynthesis